MTSAIVESVLSFLLAHWWFLFSYGFFFVLGAGWYRYMLKTNPAKLAALVAATSADLQPLANVIKPAEQAVVNVAESVATGTVDAVTNAVNSAVTNTVTTAVTDAEKKL